MLSSLPKLTSKSFIIGQFVPSLVFLISISGVFLGFEYANNLLKTISDENNVKSIAIIVVIAVSLSTILMAINDDIYKFYEGYYFPLNKFSFLVKRKIRARNKINKKIEELYDKAEDISNSAAKISDIKSKAEDLLLIRRNQFPRFESDVLPTSFGNAIRSFEDYPRAVYGADSVIIWPRISVVASKELVSSIENARSYVDLFLNLSFYCIIISIITASNYTLWISEKELGLPLPFWKSFPTTHWAAGISIFLAVVGAVVFYRMAVKRVYPWGNQVRSLFDLHLPDLAKRLGFKMPEGADQRREMWGEIGRQFAYHTPADPSKWASPAGQRGAHAPPERLPPPRERK